MATSFKEHDTVVLLYDYENYGLKVGDVGAIVYVYDGHDAFDVEFTKADGRPVAILTPTRNELRPMRDDDLLHVRQAGFYDESRV